MSTPAEARTDTTIITDVQATLEMLVRAGIQGLPMPWDVDVTEGQISLALGSLAELAQWAQHMEAPVVEEDAGGCRHYTVDGELHDRAAHCWHNEEISEISEGTS